MIELNSHIKYYKIKLRARECNNYNEISVIELNSHIKYYKINLHARECNNYDNILLI